MWIHLPTSVSSAEQEVSTSASDSLCQTLAVSAMWRQKFLQPRFWRLALKRNPLMMRLFGRISEPSTADHGADLWMESLAASRAQITRSQESEKALSESTDNSGTTFAAASARFDPNGSIWRTCPESLYPTRFDVGDGILTDENGRLTHSLPDSGLFLGTWPRSGSMRNGLLYQRPKLALRTSGNAGSAWPTARAEDSESCGNHPNALDSLSGATREWGGQWITPDAHTGARPGMTATSGGQVHLVQQANNWGTPRATDAKCGSAYTDATTGKDLAKDVTRWANE